MFSFWEQETFIKSPELVIIGSGIVGLNAAIAYKRARPDAHVLILERGMLPYGASTRNAGFACFGSPSELLEDIRVHGSQKVYDLISRRWNGILLLKKLLGEERIGFEQFGGYELFFPGDDTKYGECVELLPAVNKVLRETTGQENVFTSADESITTFGFRSVSHLLFNRIEAQINTGEMMKALVSLARENGIEILNGADVVDFNTGPGGLEINVRGFDNTQTTIKATRLLIATNGFAKKFLPSEDIIPARAQVLITSSISNLKIRGTFHFDHGYYYFRNVGNRLLFGGARNLEFKNETTESFGTSEIIQSRLEKLLKESILPGQNYVIEKRWSGIMGLGGAKEPIVKQVDKNIFCAVRLGGMGVAIGAGVGAEAAELILQS